MSRMQTLLAKLTAKPTPADFKFSELCKVMAYFDYHLSNKGATSGSRVKFTHQETKETLLLHKPHPGDVLPKSTVDYAIDFLKERGHI